MVYRQKIILAIKREGIPLRGSKKLSTLQETEICDSYQKGQKTTFLASRYKVNIAVIRRVLKDHLIRVRSNADEHRICSIDDSFFKQIDKEWKAYFLGLLFADGCNYDGKRITLSLTGNDERILLENLCSYVYKHKPYPIRTTNGNCHRLTIVNLAIAQDALRLGLVPRKTYGCKFPVLQKEYIWHFIRGYFDGDGGTHFQRKKQKINVSIVGCRTFLDDMYNEMKNKGIQLSIYPTQSFAEMIRFSSKKSIDIFYHAMYDNATIWPNRKREKFKEWDYARNYSF